MGRTATELGREFGRTAREMNQLLKQHGFIEGDPGAYRPTALGKQFARAIDFDNGYGGLAHRQWGWLSWTDGVVDALRSSMAANPEGVAAVTTAAPRVAVPDVSLSPASLRPGSHLLPKSGWVAVVVLAGLGASTPLARRAWREKVKPAASRVRSRVAERKGTRGADELGTGR